MMRVRMSERPDQRRADPRPSPSISREFGTGFADITTRQQMQLRGFGIERRPGDLASGSTRSGSCRCRPAWTTSATSSVVPLAGLTPHELFDASPVVREFTEMFLRQQGVHQPAAQVQRRDHRLHRELHACRIAGSGADAGDRATRRRETSTASTSLIGGKMGSGGFRPATPLDVFVPTGGGRGRLCSQITFIFRDHGSRAARNRARLAFLDRGVGRRAIPARARAPDGSAAAAAGRDARGAQACRPSRRRRSRSRPG